MTDWAAQADAIVRRWPFKGNAYFDRAVSDVAAALAEAYGQGRDDEAAGEPLPDDAARPGLH